MRESGIGEGGSECALGTEINNQGVKQCNTTSLVNCKEYYGTQYAIRREIKRK